MRQLPKVARLYTALFPIDMKKLKRVIRLILPKFLIQRLKKVKKKRHNRGIEEQRLAGTGIDEAAIVLQLQEMGISAGDTLLVHSSLSKMGYVEGGAKTVVSALMEVVGTDGHLLMPTSPNNHLQLEYVQRLSEFDVLKSPSTLGAISEYFRKLPDVKRSLHPTEPVSCWGKDAAFYVGSHFGQLTPYNENSPFYKVADTNGKILMIGVTLDNAGTNLHCLEDAVDFKYPVYCYEIFEVKVRDEAGVLRVMKTKVHNPVWSKRRKCDELIPLFEKNGALTRLKLGMAECLLIDAKAMLEIMLLEYKERGVTMYTPKGD